MASIMLIDTLHDYRMSIADNLVRLRREQTLTQQQMAELSGLHVNQIRRYEAGSAQPSLDGLKKIAIALHVKLDDLVFRPGERGPIDEQLRLQFEAISKMPREEKKVVQSILDGMIVKHRAKLLVGDLRS